MIVMNNLVQQNQPRAGYHRTTMRLRDSRTPIERIGGYVCAFERRRRSLEHIEIIYRQQPAIQLFETTETINRLIDARRVVLGALAYLRRLAPDEVEQLRPAACLVKLEMLDYLCTQIILNATMFSQVCQRIDAERTRLHLEIRASLPVMLSNYDDVTAMLAAVVEREEEQR
jgi:hypothetical protein